MNLIKAHWIYTLLWLVLFNAAATPVPVASETPIRVVTSFSILQDLVKQLGGEQVTVTNLVQANSDAHMYQPKPSDAVSLAKADIVIFNGLNFEGWMSRLIKNSDYGNQQLIASNGVSVITSNREIDPHAWQSFTNIRVYIENISNGLIALKPEQRHLFTQRKIQYLTTLELLEQELKGELKDIPPDKRIVVTSHDAFGYLGREFNINFLAPVGLSPDVEASAQDVASIINQIRDKDVRALFVENITNPRLLQRISSETGVAIGGHLYSDALSDRNGPANTYLSMMQHNIQSLIAAMKAN